MGDWNTRPSLIVLQLLGQKCKKIVKNDSIYLSNVFISIFLSQSDFWCFYPNLSQSFFFNIDFLITIKFWTESCLLAGLVINLKDLVCTSCRQICLWYKYWWIVLSTLQIDFQLANEDITKFKKSLWLSLLLNLLIAITLIQYKKSKKWSIDLLFYTL